MQLFLRILSQYYILRGNVRGSHIVISWLISMFILYQVKSTSTIKQVNQAVYGLWKEHQKRAISVVCEKSSTES